MSRCNRYVFARVCVCVCVWDFQRYRPAVFLHISLARSSLQPRRWHWFGVLFKDTGASLCWEPSKHPPLLINSLPKITSPISFFLGPFPKLLLRDHEKKLRFLSALSSLVSSFGDLPERCFLTSWGVEDKQTCYPSVRTHTGNDNNSINSMSPFNEGYTFFGVDRVERSELALCFEGAGLQGIWYGSGKGWPSISACMHSW